MPPIEPAEQPSQRRQLAICVAIVILAPLLVKAPLLLGILISDPLALYSGIATNVLPGPFGGFPPMPTIDPNIAFTSHTLGHRAALDILSGHLPWWNHYEGVGVPLAGEMQAAALSPLNVLLALPNGQLYMHLSLQIIAGLSTWALLRKLGCVPLAALAGALAFEFNGTFAWLANAIVNPVPFLPMVLLGVENLREHIAEGRRGNAAWIAIGIAGSLYAGFPEVAYLNGLLIVVWTLVRAASVPGATRGRFVMHVAVGGLVGLAIAAPIVLAFFDYLPLSDTGGHAGDGFAGVVMQRSTLLGTWMPYAFGGIFQLRGIEGFWGAIGGYAGIALSVLALYGMCGKRLRGLRIALAVWVLVTLGMTYGVPGIHALARIIPGVKYAAFFRYFPPSWELALCVLSALALTDIGSQPRPARLKLAVAATALACLLSLIPMIQHHIVPTGMIAHGGAVFGLAVLLALAVVAWRMDVLRSPATALATVLIVESVVNFLVPTLSHPRHSTVHLTGVRYLQDNLGLNRFATFGPIAPNYGSYFGIASINYNDLPAPSDWTHYVNAHLDSNQDPIPGVTRHDPNGPSAADSLIANREAYARIGVRYALVPSNIDAPDFRKLRDYLAGPPNQDLKEVYRDEVMRILELSAPAPYFSAPGCTITPQDRDAAHVQCDAPSKLSRLELFMPGWRATVNGNEAPIARSGEIFQEVELPAGHADIQFRFLPPHMKWAYLALLLGCLVFAFDALRGYRSGKPR
ncbi:YfhO family protein [Paraburkholderia sp. Ac-20342]|uniref:hypothetical protein n=1 Tax=Paraburkholderia sp. Ac-20342 TaxID=2703889 RepID=UPI001980E830|nr:hypothetical protein [Paraburkholderia sp. Ac-20342]MBN3845280.1 YfhO family protein [Paraburkholderia sp. Ac-20342]